MIKFTANDIFLVTGASSGIGRAAALLLNSCGASVIANGRNENALKELKAECDNKDNLYIEAKDLLEDIESLPLWIKSLKDKYGKLKGLICSAGITHTEPVKIIDYNKAKNIMDINYFVPLMLTKGFIDKRVRVNSGSSITFISSIAAINGKEGLTIYSGSKGALLSSIKSMVREFENLDIRINSICPSLINSPMVQMEIEQGFINVEYEKYIGEPENIADIIVFLCSDKGKWINGENIIADKGAYLFKMKNK